MALYLEIRPYQLLCLICRIGGHEAGVGEDRVECILSAIRANPDGPITLHCNAGDVYVYQDPGTSEDTPSGLEYNRKRDLDILQKLDLAPGSTLPARTLLLRVLHCIPSVRGICEHGSEASVAWRGCPYAQTGHYEVGHAKGIDAIIPPRTATELAREKQESLAALYSAEIVTIRPHILMCAVCQYGSGVRPPFEPDNLPEFLQMVLTEKPNIPVQLVSGADWMMCAPCPKRVPALNACVNVAGSGGLSNEKRDLDLLQILGLTYGATMPARDLLLLLLQKAPSTQPVCSRDNRPPSVWWDNCGEQNQHKGSENYERGRQMILEILQDKRGKESDNARDHRIRSIEQEIS